MKFTLVFVFLLVPALCAQEHSTIQRLNQGEILKILTQAEIRGSKVVDELISSCVVIQEKRRMALEALISIRKARLLAEIDLFFASRSTDKEKVASVDLEKKVKLKDADLQKLVTFLTFFTNKK